MPVSPEQARAELARRELARREAAAAQSVSAQPQPGPIEPGARSRLREVSQGSTLGFTDELTAAIVGAAAHGRPQEGAAAFDQVPRDTFADVYSRTLEEERNAQHAFRQGNPVESMALNVVGSLAPAALIGGRMSLPAGAANLGQRLGRTIGSAIGGGAIAGTGEAEGGIGDRAVGAAVGGVAGAVLGPILQGGVRASRSVFRAGRSMLPPDTKKVLRNIARQTGESAEAIMERWHAMGPDATLADVSENFRVAADMAASRVGRAREAAIAKFEARSKASLGRIMGPIKRTLGGIDEAVESIDDLQRIRVERAAPLYRQAMGTQVPDEVLSDLDPILKNNRVRKLIKEMKDALPANGDDLPRQNFDDGGKLTFAGLHRLQSRMREEAFNQRVGRGREGFRRMDAGAMDNARREIAEKLEDLTGGADGPYGQARRTWFDQAAADDALQAGDRFIGESITDVQNTVKGLTEDQRAFYKISVGRALEERLSRVGDTRETGNIFKNEAMRKKLRLAFGNDDAADDLIRTIDIESEFQKTKNLVGRGSQTEIRKVVGEQIEGGRGLDIPMTPQEIARLAATSARMTEGSVQKLGDLLVSSDQATRQAVEEILKSAPHLRDMPIGALVGGMFAGQVSGRARQGQ